ncbi:MAG: pitrilysin family protein [Nanoarchaeota archaeon]|nr:pitrilysin family protein [Nanoarchaeota archaeon]
MELYRKTLSCGAKFIGCDFAGTKPNLALGLLVPRGSAHDPAELEGSHHFLEHLLFKSKQNSLRNELARMIEDHGGNWNAWTDYLHTVVHCTLAQDQADIGVSFLTELANRSPEFSPQNLGIERKVIYREIERANDDPAELVSSLAHNELYLPPFAGPILGTKESVERMTTTDMLHLWQKGYSPSHFTIVAVGKVNFNDLAGEFESRLEKSSLNGNGQGDSEGIIIQPQEKGCRTVIKEGLEQCHFGFATHTPFPSDHLFNAFILLDTYLTEGTFSELNYTIRERRGEAYGVEGELDCGRGYGLYVVKAGISPHKVKEIYDLIREGFNSAIHMEERELDRLKIMARGREDNTEFDKEDLMTHLLRREDDGRGAESFFRINEDYERISLDQIRYVANIREPTIVTISPGDFPA